MNPLRRQILDAMQHEVSVIRHLGTKVSPDTLDWRPTPGQRSLGELLQYLTYCGSIGVLAAINRNWEHGDELERAASEVTPATFDAAMLRQLELIASALEKVGDVELATATTQLPWGAEVGLLRALIEMGPKVMGCYRMQFFLYLKQSGQTQLDSANCWVGVDRRRPQE